MFGKKRAIKQLEIQVNELGLLADTDPAYWTGLFEKFEMVSLATIEVVRKGGLSQAIVLLEGLQSRPSVMVHPGLKPLVDLQVTHLQAKSR